MASNGGIYVKLMVKLRDRLSELKGARLSCLICIACHWDGEDSWPSVRTICQETGLSSSVVCPALAALEHDGWITREAKKGCQTHYRITTDLLQMGVSEIETVSAKCFGNRNGSVAKTETVTVSETETEEETISKKKPLKKNDTYTPAFEDWFAGYPRKDGKRDAFVQWGRRLKEGVSSLVLTAGRDNYRDFLKADGTPIKFTKLASTFIGPNRHYEEWQEPRKAEGATHGRTRTGDRQLSAYEQAYADQLADVFD